jgi:hypothetical protein
MRAGPDAAHHGKSVVARNVAQNLISATNGSPEISQAFHFEGLFGVHGSLVSFCNKPADADWSGSQNNGSDATTGWDNLAERNTHWPFVLCRPTSEFRR